MIAVRDQGDPHRSAAERLRDGRGFPPRDVGVPHSVQQMDGTARIPAFAEDPMPAAVLDHAPGQRVRPVSVTRRAPDDPGPAERPALRAGQAGHPIREVRPAPDADEAPYPAARPASTGRPRSAERAREQQHQPGPHARADEDEVAGRPGGEEGEGVPIPDIDAPFSEVAGRAAVAPMVEAQRGEPPLAARRRDPARLPAFHVRAEPRQVHDRGRVAGGETEGEANAAMLERVDLHSSCSARMRAIDPTIRMLRSRAGSPLGARGAPLRARQYNRDGSAWRRP